MLTKLETKFAFSLAKGKWRTVMVYYKQLNETGIVAVTMKLEEQMLITSCLAWGARSTPKSSATQYLQPNTLPILCLSPSPYHGLNMLGRGEFL